MFIKTIRNVLILGIVFGVNQIANAATIMDFGTNDGTNGDPSSFASYTQNGLTMRPIDSGFRLNPNHWDRIGNPLINGNVPTGATADDNSARIHRGNNGEEVVFSHVNGTFDLLSFDIEAITLKDATSITGTLLSSSGSIYIVSAIGTIDFTGLEGWSNISSFSFSVPKVPGQLDICGQSTTDCSGIVFDNVITQVPVPTTLILFGSGLIGLIRVGKKPLNKKYHID